ECSFRVCLPSRKCEHVLGQSSPVCGLGNLVDGLPDMRSQVRRPARVRVRARRAARFRQGEFGVRFCRGGDGWLITWCAKLREAAPAACPRDKPSSVGNRVSRGLRLAVPGRLGDSLPFWAATPQEPKLFNGLAPMSAATSACLCCGSEMA